MEIQLEEGEISNGPDIDPYIPLLRPKISYESSVAILPSKSESTLMIEDSENNYNRKKLSSDSDTEDEDTYAKKLKLTIPIKNEKYSVWNKDPNGDLTDDLKKVEMIDDRDKLFERSVENYSVPNCQKTQSSNNQSKFNRKRKHPNKNKKNADLKYGSVDEIPFSLIATRLKTYAKNGKRRTKIIRNLESLTVDESSTFEEVADDIAEKLNERNVQLILRIVVVLGKKKAFQLFEKTRVIEKLGGLLINNGSRKRTSGGVFINLVRSDKDLSKGQLNAIFEEEYEERRCQRALSKQRRRKRKKGALTELSNPPPSPNLPELPDRKDLVEEIDNFEATNEITPEKIDQNIL